MRDRRGKLAVLVLCAFCILAQDAPAYAAVKTGTYAKEGPALQDTGRELLQESAGIDADEAAGGQVKAAPEEPGAQQQPGDLDSTPDDMQQPGSPNEPDSPDNPDEPDNPDNPDNPENPDNPGDPNEPENPDNPDELELPAPKKPKGLRTTCQSDTKVLLEWNESDDAASYEIFRKTGSGSYKALATVKKPGYTDKGIVYGKTYGYRVVPLNAKGVSGAAAEITFSHGQVVSITKQKYSYHAMKNDMQALAKTYSDYCELTSIGTSVEGRAIYDFAIGNPNAGKSLLVVSTLHAREYICSAMLMREIEYYLRNYNRKISGIKPAELLKNVQIHYIVMANPDGVTISQTTYPRWKANSRGVDLNRNFPAKGGFYPGGKKGSEGYSGKKALSEPESRAVAAFTKKLKSKQGLQGVVNYHAMGQIVFGGCSDKKIKGATQKMYQIARGLTGYRDAGGYSSGSGKPVGGQYREYVMDMLKLPSVTIEVGATWAPCAFREYNSVFEKNKLVVLKIANAL